jgi:trk system potassium uptake protein TrkA
MPIVGMKLKDISSKMSSSLIGAVLRDNNAIIPKGDFEILTGDTIFIVGKPDNISGFLKYIGLYSQRVRNVMIIGGGRVAYYLAKALDEAGMRVKVIEIDHERCLALSELLPHAIIIHGDGSDEAVLQSENLSDMGAFISLTGRDEDNFMAALLAKQAGVPKVVAKINRLNYISVIKRAGIDSVINPSLITTNIILRYVRGMKNALNNSLEALYKIVDNQAEAVEFSIQEQTAFLDVPIRKLKLVDGVLLAVLVRKNEIIIPHGDDVLKKGDSVILISKNKKIYNLNDIMI